MSAFKNLFNCAGIAALIMALVGCGGGGGEQVAPVVKPPTFSANYLSKYQNTWFQKCSSPIEYGAGSFGPSSFRERLVVSAPDVNGQVNLDLVEEFFDSTLSCYDYISKPFASVQSTLLATGKMLRIESLLLGGVSNVDQDVLLVSQPPSPVVATGTGVTQVSVGGKSYWRITFTDGKFVDRPTLDEGWTGEVAFFPVTVNGVPGAELSLNGDMQGSFGRP